MVLEQEVILVFSFQNHGVGAGSDPGVRQSRQPAGRQTELLLLTGPRRWAGVGLHVYVGLQAC